MSRSEHVALATQLRRDGVHPSRIGHELRERYGINGRRAQRIARGWTQEQAAGAWSARWPDDPKTFKNISYWENWPAPTGHAPSLMVLDRLAELYGCNVGDLIAEWGAHGGPSAARRAEPESLAWQVQNLNLPELTRSIADWAAILPAESRRVLLLKMSSAVAAATGPSDEPFERYAGRIGDLSGPWTSSYTFFSSGRGQEYTCEHQIELDVSDGRLTGRSFPTSTGHIELDLRVSGMLVTGSWTERTAPDGYYAGAVYHGVLQMVLDPTGRTMRGQWLGADKGFEVRSGRWSLMRGYTSTPTGA